MTRRLALILCLAAATALAAPASANSRDVGRLGQCSKSSRSKIVLHPENGLIHVAFTVNSRVTGQTWRVILKRNRKVRVRARARTGHRSGAFTFRRWLDNRRGTRDKVVGYAKSPYGEFCRAVAVLPG